jgi:hypothetical protein
MLKRLIHSIKNQDLFSHQITMHFGTFLDKNSEGDAFYKTTIGGFISICLKVFLCYYIYFFFN